jgi:hypothetical protein
MGLVIRIDQTLPGHMGVNLGGGEASMAEEILNTSEVGTSVEEMRCEAMTEGVRARGRVQSLTE